jgi:hypothetical protein
MLLFAVRPYLSVAWRLNLILLYWLLIPYLGLILGGLSPRLMGFTDIDWQASLSLGAGLIVGILATLAAVRLTSTGDNAAERTPEDTMIRPRRHLIEFFKNGAEEFHWCFLRGACWELLLALPTPPEFPGYVAIWVAGALALGERLLTQVTGRLWLPKLILLLATTVLFFYTRNFWLCWLLHALAWLVLAPTSLAQSEPAWSKTGGSLPSFTGKNQRQ